MITTHDTVIDAFGLPFSNTIYDHASELETNITSGLTQRRCDELMQKYGPTPNKLYEIKQISFFKTFLNEIREPLMILLLVIAVFYAIWGEFLDSIIVFIIISLMAVVEVSNEYRAKKAVLLLGQSVKRNCTVRRDDTLVQINHDHVLLGDILVLAVGQYIPADARIIDCQSLQVNESILTGESIPVDKSPDDHLYAGTFISKGKCTALVYAIGKSTQVGSNFVLLDKIRETHDIKTPLQVSMKQIAKYLTIVAIVSSIIVPLIGWLRGAAIKPMILYGLSLAFCLIPEELPILIKSVLAIGSLDLSKKNVLIKKLNAAEMLGCVTFILTDKTGTLTRNQLELSKCIVPNGTTERELIINWILASDMESTTLSMFVNEHSLPTSIDPFETAMLTYLQNNNQYSVVQEALLIMEQEQHVQYIPFDNETKISTVIRGRNNRFIKGAPDVVMSQCTGDLYSSLQTCTKQGLRVIAVAYGKESLVLSGLLAFEDPCRNGVQEQIQVCKQAGIHVSMITGDHDMTALSIADKTRILPKEEYAQDAILVHDQLVQLSDDQLQEIVDRVSVYARATPVDKYRVCNALQQQGHIVAVTGDGVNDAIALASAHVGVAMGKSGSDVARQAADILLLDDRFETLSLAIKESRKLYSNLVKSIQFYLSCKLGLLIMFSVTLAFGLPFPLTPIQVCYISN